MTTTQNRFRQAAAALVALTVVLSVFGPVGTAAAQSVSISQTADSTSVAPGGTVTLTATLDVQDANSPAIDVDLPTGWTIVSHTDDGGSFKESEDQWVWLEGDADGVNVTHTVTYTVQVPEGEATGDYDIWVEGSALQPDGTRLTDTQTTTITVEEQNQAPTADAGPDLTVDEAANVVLDGAASTDPDGDTLTYSWTQTAGPSVTLNDTSSPTPSFTAPEVTGETTLTFELTVSDGNGGTDTDTVNVTVQDVPENAEPTADAGDDQTVDEGASVSLNATGSSDPDGDSLTYSWTQTAGPAVTLSDASSATPSFTAPEVSADTTLTFELTVSDGNGGTDTDAVNVTIQDVPENAEPIADAGDDQVVDEGTSVSLDATGSSDPDDDTLTYSWTQTAGPTVTLSDTSSATPSFTAPEVDGETTLTFELTVSDANGGSDTDTVNITVQNVAEPPAADMNTTVSLSPTSSEVAVNSTTTFDLVVDDAEGGVGAYTATVSLDDASVAAITDVQVGGDPATETTDVDIASDGSSVTINAALMNTSDTGSVTIATITVQGESVGTANLSTSVEALGDEQGNSYTVTGTSGASLSVVEITVGDFQNPVTDPDGDGQYEDINGDGVFNIIDVQALFANLDDSALQNNLEKFDFNNDGVVNIVDVQALFFELINSP